MRATNAGLRSVPSVACKTIWSDAVAALEKSACTRLSASDDCVLCSWNRVEKALPTPRSTAKIPTSATNHRARTTRRRRKHHPPRARMSTILREPARPFPPRCPHIRALTGHYPRDRRSQGIRSAPEYPSPSSETDPHPVRPGPGRPLTRLACAVGSGTASRVRRGLCGHLLARKPNALASVSRRPTSPVLKATKPSPSAKPAERRADPAHAAAELFAQHATLEHHPLPSLTLTHHRTAASLNQGCGAPNVGAMVVT